MGKRPRWGGDRLELLLVAALLASVVLVKPRVAESDAIEYYSYLPSLFFDHDLDFTDEYTYFYLEDPEGREGFKQTFLDLETATGHKLNFGPIGSALLWSPFYLAAHLGVLLARAFGTEVAADGLSLPYRWAVAVGSMLLAGAGLVFSYRLARCYASAEASLTAVVALWWASPVAYYMYVAPAMSHSPSLFAVALFFLLWRWAARGGVARWVLWGASAGLMALVREQDGLFAVVALLAAFSPALEAGWSGRLKRLAAFGAAALAVFSPQLLVYLVLYGRPAPSPHVQDKMVWSSPHFFQVLFSPQHGLFFWSPLLALFVVGAIVLFRRDREAAVLLAVGFVSEVYVSGAVESWTQAGAFGSRRFVATTAIFAVWGALLFHLLKPRVRAVGVMAMASFFILWNLSLMVQFGLGLMDRQKLVWRQVVHNHIYEVPPRLLSVVGRYWKAREKIPDEQDRQ